MNDLNLMPQEIKIQEEAVIKRRNNMILLIIALIVLIVITCIPTYFQMLFNKENKLVESDIVKLSNVSDEVNKLTDKRKSIQEKLKILDSVTNVEIKWTDIISNISSMMPSDITVNKLNMSIEKISMECSSVSQQSIAVFLANMENSNKYSSIKIDGIIPDDKTKNYTFNISFNLKNIDNKVK
jgi:Tfp pilus assembly protein PilN